MAEEVRRGQHGCELPHLSAQKQPQSSGRAGSASNCPPAFPAPVAGFCTQPHCTAQASLKLMSHVHLSLGVHILEGNLVSIYLQDSDLDTGKGNSGLVTLFPSASMVMAG